MDEHVPAEVFPPGDFIAAEMEARGWTSEDVARRMPGDFLVNMCCVDMILNVHDTNLLLDAETAAGLAAAFGVSAQYFLNLDAMWRKYGPPSRHATAH